MRAVPDRYGRVFERPLQRRGLPFGPAAWSNPLEDGNKRGLLGQFFCASIEDQFEHLMGQWAARPPLGSDPADSAADPLNGPHADPAAALLVPLKDKPTQRLSGFKQWITPLGTMYAWYPGRQGYEDLINRNFEPDDTEGPWQ
jgi:hypothetical protein